MKRANKKLRRTKTSINFTCKYLRKNALCPGEEGERLDGEEGVRLWCLDLEEIAPPRLATFIQGVSKKDANRILRALLHPLVEVINTDRTHYY